MGGGGRYSGKQDIKCGGWRTVITIVNTYGASIMC